jgi:hypothetical protein
MICLSLAPAAREKSVSNWSEKTAAVHGAADDYLGRMQLALTSVPSTELGAAEDLSSVEQAPLVSLHDAAAVNEGGRVGSHPAGHR